MSQTFSVTLEINAPPARVWEVLKDIERWHEWTKSVTSVKRLDAGPLRVGSRAEIAQPQLPPAKFTVTALEDNRGFTWETRSGGVRAVADHWIEDRGGVSRVTLAVRFEGLLAPVVAGFARRITEKYLAMEAAGLKSRSESVSA